MDIKLHPEQEMVVSIEDFRTTARQSNKAVAIKALLCNKKRPEEQEDIPTTKLPWKVLTAASDINGFQLSKSHDKLASERPVMLECQSDDPEHLLLTSDDVYQKLK
ncbi:3729_t:CDS:2 [Paraglomus brasilianum]|uniref:3729_t:CDS:1 n=1 Tax=Paraglomus brasilianum TaxID=144538 RepID=A0A9N9GAE0_9GLOM|nr:3729_t:CDS:2 [Paraglomus brasilianum]